MIHLDLPPRARARRFFIKGGRVVPLAAGAFCCVFGTVGAMAQDSTSSGSAGGSGTGSASGGAAGAAPGSVSGNNIGAGSSFGSSGIGYGSSILPATGFGGNLGAFNNLRDFVNPPAPRGVTRNYDVQVSLGVQAGYTDNVQGLSSGGGNKPQGSFEGKLLPSVTLVGEGRRVKVNLTYNPVVYYFPQVDSQSRIDQFLNGGATGEIISQTLFLDLRAFATQTSNSGIYGPTSTSVLNRADRQQLYSFSANPYLVHEFGSHGTARLGYTIANTYSNSTSNQLTPSNFNSFNNGFNNTANGRTLTQSEDASYTTGEDFGRFQHTVAVGASQFSGSGATRGGHRNQATYDVAFAYNRFVTFIGRGGYQDILYNGTTSNGVLTSLPYSLKEPIWSVGVKLTPNQDSSLAISYGHVDGGESVTLDAAYKPTARIALYATSSSGVTTDAQQVQSFVANSQVNASGVTIDPRTGAPVQFSNSSVNNNANQLYRLTRTSLSAAYLLNRDTFNASVIREERSNPGGVVLRNQNSTSTYGSLSWQHDVSDLVKTNVSTQYGVQEIQGSGSQPGTSNPTLSVNGGVTRIFTEKLSGSANYTYFRRDSSLQTQRVTVNEFLLGLMQRF